MIKVKEIGANQASREHTELWETIVERFPTLNNTQVAQVVSLVVGSCAAEREKAAKAADKEAQTQEAEAAKFPRHEPFRKQHKAAAQSARIIAAAIRAGDKQ